MKGAISRCLLLLAVTTCLLSAHASAGDLQKNIHARQATSNTAAATTAAATTTSTTPPSPPTPTPPPTPTLPAAATTTTTTAAATTSTPTTATTPTTAQAPTTSAGATTTSAAPTAATTQPTTTSQQQSGAQQSTSTPTAGGATTAHTSLVVSAVLVTTSQQVTTTDAAGQVFTSVILITATSSSTMQADVSTSSPTSSSDTSSGLGTGSIVGLSVAGGIAVIGIVAFFVWKFTRKRFADFDDNEAIKWPELNTHGSEIHALPTKSTGRSGFGAENDSELNLSRAPSPGGYAHSASSETYNNSQDPYAVPPLPHLNPNQPYHDEPGTYNQPGYYDPYRGAVPNTYGDGGYSDNHGTEAIPMTRMARTRSPGPQMMAYDGRGPVSPGPQAAMGYGLERTASPAVGPSMPSPNPQAPYGYGP